MNITIQRCNQGSQWYYGNFELGLLLDNHPTFCAIIFGFVFFRIIVKLK